MPSIGFGRGKRLIVATAAIAATGGSALAFTGQPNSGGPPTSAAPDMVSASVVRYVDPGDPLGPQARICFDEVINPASIGGTAFRLSTYDTDKRIASTSATIDTQDPKCVIATFANGEDISQMTVSYTAAVGSVSNNSGIQAPQESAPVNQQAGRELAPVEGSTTAPDLVSFSVDPGATPPQVTYTFDENLDPALAGGGAALASKFGFYVDTDDGAAPRRGSAVQGVTRNSIVIAFTVADAVQQGKLFFVDPLGAGDSPRDRIVNPALPSTGPNTISPIGHVGPAIPASPVIVSAAKQGNNQIVNMTFSQNVIPGNVGAAAPGGNVVAYRADANPIGGTYVIGTSGADLKTLPVTMPGTTQNDPASVVRLGIRPGLVRNQANDRSNTIGAAAIGTAPVQRGLSDGPDLLRTTVNDTTNTVTYVFDEPLRTNPNPSGPEFQVINADGSVSPGQAGSAVVSSDRLSVDVKFSGSVSGSSLAGVSNNFGATQDAVDDNPAAGNDALPGSVSLALISCVETGTCPTATATQTAAPTTSPSPTATPGGNTVNIKTTVTLKRKAGGKKFTGKVKAAGPCRAGRSVRLLNKKGKRVKTVPSRGNGSFVFKLKKKLKGGARAKVTKRITKQGNTTFNCSVAISKSK